MKSTGLFTLALAAFFGAGALEAQTGSAAAGAVDRPPALRVASADGLVELRSTFDRGHPAHPLTALEHLGATLGPGSSGMRVVIFGDTLIFEDGSPFFQTTQGYRQLANAAYRAGGELHVPRQLLVEWLPTRYPTRISFDDGVLRLRGVAPAIAGEPNLPESGSPEAAASAADAPQTPPTPAPQPEARRPEPRAERPSADRVRVVVLDAGHGGRDLGRVGPRGMREKDLALGLARGVAAELEARGGYEVHLTRTDDRLIPLAERPRMANEWKNGRPAALFMSIHLNAARGEARGFETFFLSEARTEDERRVAEMENAAMEYESGIPDGDTELEQLANTLRNDFYQRASSDLAETIQANLATFHPGPNRGVKQAGFRVLVGAFMPAVLVEVAFLSDRRDAELLASASFRDNVSRSLADAVERFFDGHEHLWLVEEGS